MIPFLADKFNYDGLGLGGLADAISCQVTHEINGIYELEMTYPVTGVNYSAIIPNILIFAKPDNYKSAQPFRVYRITKPLNGIVTIYAQHLCYDMSGTIVEPFTAGSLQAALTALPTKCTPATTFTISSTRTVATGYTIKAPRPLWRALGGEQGSLLDVYGGEWDFDGKTAMLLNQLGTDRGVSIRYGKNLTELEQDLSLESTYKGVYPYWYDEESNTLVTLPEDYVTIPSASSDRVMCLDCTDDFETQPTEADLRARANAYITANSVGDAKISWKVNFALLAQSKEYETQAILEKVTLGDTVHVYYEAMGVNASARVVKTEFDVLKEQYINVTIGRVKQNLAKIIVDNNQTVVEKIDTTKSYLEGAIDRSTEFIRNGGGEFRLIYSGDVLQEIVSLDNPDISQAVNVWRWNNGGFGFSSTGYNGTYATAINASGEIVADFITAGTMTANVIRAGIITDLLGRSSWDLETGDLSITGTISADNGDIAGWTIAQHHLYKDITDSGITYSVRLQSPALPDPQAYALFVSVDDGNTIDYPFRLRYNGTLTATGADIAGTFTMTGGSINIVSNNASTDLIQLSYGGKNLKLRPNQIAIDDDNGNHYVQISSLLSGYLALGTPGGSDTLVANAGTGLYMTTSSGRFDLNQSELSLSNISGGSTKKRVSITENGLKFYASDGVTLTASYPNDGTYLKNVITTADNYTLNSNGYASVTKPAEVSGARNIVSADVYQYTSATGAFEVAGYNGNLTSAYIFGEPGVVINGLRIQFWYI